MHPNRAFRNDDREAMLAFVAARGFAHLAVVAADAPMMVHAPVTVAGDTLSFHIARANRIAPHLDGARVVASVAGADGYVSPNWYASPANQVPTWNYVAVEAEGVAHRLDDAALTEQLDALAAAFEPRVNPARAWTRDKMDTGVFDRMRAAIVGFAFTVDALRGTTKLSQNKPELDRAGAIAGLIASGNHALAAAMTGAPA